MIIKPLARFVKEGKETKGMMLLFFFYVCMAILNIFIAKAVGIIVQSAISEEMSLVLHGLLWFMLAKIITIIFEYTSGVLSRNIKEKIVIRYRMLSIRSILHTKYEWIKKQNNGDILGRMQEDVSVSAEAVAIYVPDIARRLLIIGSILIVIFHNNWRLGIVFLFPIPFIFMFQFLGSNICDKYMGDSREAESERDAQIQDILNKRRTLKFFQAENEAVGWAHNKITQYIGKFTKAMIMVAVSFSPTMILNQIPTLLLCGVGCSLATKGKIQMEELIAIATLSIVASEEMRGLTHAFVNLPNMMSYSKRLFPLWDAPKEECGTEIPKNKLMDLSFHNVSFTYEGEQKRVVEDFNLMIESGEFVALVGPSGCGKSTVLKLAAGLYQAEQGEIEVSQVLLEKWNNSSYYENISFVTQDSWLFPTSIKENLQAVCGEADCEQILAETYADSLLNPIIDALPGGLDTKIGEQGINLSGGQKQRIAIVRALLKRPSLLLIDEGTSALDVETEKQVYQLLKNKYGDKTILMIAHRFSAIVNATRIIVMEKGKIVGQGTHEELLKSNSLYAKLYHAQCGEATCGKK